MNRTSSLELTEHDAELVISYFKITTDLERLGDHAKNLMGYVREVALNEEALQELARLLERVGGGNASATELYQLQFLVGMLRVQATGGAKLSQQVNQGFESLLKQQG